MTEIPKQILFSIVVAYWIAMTFVFSKAAYHFYRWFINSMPPLGKLGPLVEVFTFLFPRYLTKEGVENRGKCIKWLLVTAVMAVLWVAAIELGTNNGT